MMAFTTTCGWRGGARKDHILEVEEGRWAEEKRGVRIKDGRRSVVRIPGIL
jgi:hypothetical protein